MFTFQNDVVNKFPQTLVPVSQYLSDVANGTLPQVAIIAPPPDVFLDEHPTETSPVNIQAGPTYAASLLNALMNRPSCKDSSFLFPHHNFSPFFPPSTPH